MRASIRTCFGLMLLGIQCPLLASSQVEMQWQNPEKYRDIKPAAESRKRFRESTFRHLDEYVQKLAEKLPEDSKLVMTVTDLDLAGQVWPASFYGLGHGMSDVRVIKNMDIPRMSFSYKLISSSGDVVQAAEVKLKDMGFMNRSNQIFKSETLRYEKNMLKEWFNEEFSSQIKSS